jgi:CheY-like chemotaxis protein
MLLLIVDDDADDRKLFIESVKEIDETIECLTSKDGKDALELLSNPTSLLPDFIFLDLKMPRFNGRKFLSEIKNADRLKHIPVVIYTTSKEIKDSKELKEMGAVHFITKPNNPEEVYYLISFVLDEQWYASLKNSEI